MSISKYVIFMKYVNITLCELWEDIAMKTCIGKTGEAKEFLLL